MPFARSRQSTRERLEPDMSAGPPRILQELLAPQSVQRAERRSRSLQASSPHRMISGTNATGLRCRHRSQTNQSHGEPRRSSSSVGLGGLLFTPARVARFAALRRDPDRDLPEEARLQGHRGTMCARSTVQGRATKRKLTPQSGSPIGPTARTRGRPGLLGKDRGEKLPFPNE